MKVEGIIIGYLKDVYRKRITFYLYNGDLNEITESYDSVLYEEKDLYEVFNDERTYDEIKDLYEESIDKKIFLMEHKSEIINENGYIL